MPLRNKKVLRRRLDRLRRRKRSARRRAYLGAKYFMNSNHSASPKTENHIHIHGNLNIAQLNSLYNHNHNNSTTHSYWNSNNATNTTIQGSFNDNSKSSKRVTHTVHKDNISYVAEGSGPAEESVNNRLDHSEHQNKSTNELIHVKAIEHFEDEDQTTEPLLGVEICEYSGNPDASINHQATLNGMTDAVNEDKPIEDKSMKDYTRYFSLSTRSMFTPPDLVSIVSLGTVMIIGSLVIFRMKHFKS